MLRKLVSILLLLPLAAHAQGISGDKMRECGQKAWLFSMAAQYRDSRLSPQEFMKFVEHNHPNPFVLDGAYIKKVTNAVYFDDRFAGASSSDLYQSMADACINPAPQYQPLK